MARVACKAGLGARLGVPCSAAELAASLQPAEYAYPAELTAAQLRQLQAQLGVGTTAQAPPSAMGSAVPSLRGGAAAVPPAAAAAGAAQPLQEDHYHHGSSHLAFELDDDCLKLLLGEDEDETPVAAAARTAPPPSRPLTRSGKAAAPAAAGSANGSEKSSACHEEPAAAAGAAGEAEAASRHEEEEDIAMLFGGADHARHTSALEPFALHLLGASPLRAADDDGQSTGSASRAPSDAADALADACVLEAAAEAGAGLKRQCPASPAAPSPAAPAGRGLMLSMNYEAAAESINLELLGGGGRSKASCPEHGGLGAMLLAPTLLSEPGPPGLDTPESPDSLASGSDLAVPPALDLLQRSDSCGKRKRAAAVLVA